MAKLIATSGADRGTEHVLTRPAVLGRHESAEVVLADRRSSRQHARIEEVDGRFFIEDLGSRNGTLVNDEMVTRQALCDGDQITICDTRFVFREDAPLSPERRPATGVAGAPASAAGAPFPAGARPAAELSSSLRRSMVTFLRDTEEEEGPQLNAVMDVGIDPEAPISDPSLALSGTGKTAEARAARNLRSIWKVSNALVTIHDLQELLEEVMKQIFQIFPQADRGFVMLKEEGAEELKARVIRSRNQKPGEAVEIKISSGVVSEVMTKRKAVLSSDALSDDRFSDRLSIVNLQIRSMMAAPLIVKGDILGLIHVDTTSRSQSFAEQDLELLTSIAPQVAIAIKNAQLMKQVEMEAERRAGLQRYLSPDLVELIMQNKLDVAAGRRRGTAFFSDIIGFTRMSERLSPQEVVDRLNQYFHVMEEIIFRHGGTIDKFGGDSIMAFWGVLVEKEGAVLSAVTAAVEMQNALFAFNLAVGGELARDPLRMGIGLNTGEFIAGDIGSAQKVEFTVIGDSVNLAQRIESKAGRGQAFISQATYREVAADLAAVELPEVDVKGKSGPVKMYSVRAVRLVTGAVSALDGMLASIPVRMVRGGGDTDGFGAGLIVWAKEERKRLLVEICCDGVPKEGMEIEIGPRVQEKPGLADFTGRVIAARASASSPRQVARSPGSALVEIPRPPKPLLALVAPGSVSPADITAEQIVRQ